MVVPVGEKWAVKVVAADWVEATVAADSAVDLAEEDWVEELGVEDSAAAPAAVGVAVPAGVDWVVAAEEVVPAVGGSAQRQNLQLLALHQ